MKPIIPEIYTDLLKSKSLAHIATIGPKGEPQSNPVWFDWDGEYFLFSQTKKRQKYFNLKRDPRIAASIVDLANPGRYLEIRGVVERIDEDPTFAFIDSMAKKYLNMDKYLWNQPGDERVIVVVKPQHATYQGGARQ